MKKKLYYFAFIVIVLVFLGYQYIYKDHRDIASEKAAITETTAQIFEAFSTNEAEANSKYLDKTIEVKGLITSINKNTKNVMLDSKMNARFETEIPNDLKVNDSVIVKGRLVGYDSLLEELQMDQCTNK
jgi:hypothetical protein